MDAMLFAVIFAISALGFGAIALAQKQHWLLMPCSASVPPPAWLRPAGLTFLVAAGAISVFRDGLAFGILLWTGLLTLAAMTVVVCLTWLCKRRPR